MPNFDEKASNLGSGHMLYDQADSLSGNSYSNVYLRMNLSNRSGICLGLSMGFLLYSRKYKDTQPMVWIDRFLTDSRSAWLSEGNFVGVSDLETFVGSVMEQQRGAANQFQTCTSILEDGMFGVSLKYIQNRYISSGDTDIAAMVFPKIEGFWIIGVHTPTGGHAMAVRSMIHPKTGSRLIIFFEPNYGVVQFQGVDSGAKFKEFLYAYFTDEGFTYTSRTSEIYEFS
ncbi:hypothetical protein A9Q99_18395 [Gammaproteobacteria bacterium 45_16_T64]|nr:hypothetical protein A9Q99_18395 [Gammaproteobacteria bacterium 45_16_T64]